MASFTSAEVTVTAFCGPYATGIFGANVLYIPPANYASQADATNAARTLFQKLGVELSIIATNGIKPAKKQTIIPNDWTDIDHITITSFAINQQSVLELANSMRSETGFNTLPEGDEIADDNYLLQYDNNGICTVFFIPADNSDPKPALGSWVFRVGGSGPFDTPAGNSRDLSTVVSGTLIEAQDAAAETPVISINAGPNTKPSLVTTAFFGYIIDKTQVDNNGYATSLSYGTPPLNSSRPDIKPGATWQWLPTVESYPGFTAIPTILGPVIQQGRLGQINGDPLSPFYQSVYQGWGDYNAIIHCFIPRPNDPVADDDGVTSGRFLRGYRLRILDVKRTVRTTEQTRKFRPSTTGTGRSSNSNYENINSAPVVNDVGFKYASDTGSRWLRQQDTLFGNPGPKYFKFDAIESVPIDMVDGRMDSGPTFVSTLADGSPLLTMGQPVGKSIGDAGQVLLGPMVPYQFNPGQVFAPGSSAGFFGQGGDNFVGFTPINFQTQGTYWIETTYGSSSVYVTRKPDKSEVEDYGDEQSFSLAMMVRLAEPVTVQLPQTGGFTARTSCEITDRLPFFMPGDPPPYQVERTLTPLWDGLSLVINSVDAGNGYTYLETWGGKLAYYDQDPNNGQPGDHYSWYYPGYFHPVLEPTSPAVPKGWEAVKRTAGNILALKEWGGPSDASLVFDNALPQIEPPQGNIDVGGAFYVRAWLNINPFQWGGSVPYAMPPPFSQSLSDFGQWVGETLAGNAPQWEPSIILGNESIYGDDVTLDPVPTQIISHGSKGGANVFPYQFTPKTRLTYARDVDAFFGIYTAPVFPPPVIPDRFMYWKGTCRLWVVTDNKPNPAEQLGNDRYEFTFNDGRKAFYYTDDPPTPGLGIEGLVIITGDPTPPGYKVVGYEVKDIQFESQPPPIITYSGPHFAKGPLTFFVNADENLAADLTPVFDSLGHAMPINPGTVIQETGFVGSVTVNTAAGSKTVRVYSKPQKRKV